MIVHSTEYKKDGSPPGRPVLGQSVPSVNTPLIDKKILGLSYVSPHGAAAPKSYPA